MLDDMRRYMRFGFQAMSSLGSEEPADALRSRAQGLAEQLSALAAGFREWSNEARATLIQELKDLVARQVQDMGVATGDEIRRLEARLEALERKLAPTGRVTGGSSKRTPRSKPSTSRSKPSASRAKSSASRSKSAGASRAKRGTAKSPSGRRPKAPRGAARGSAHGSR